MHPEAGSTGAQNSARPTQELMSDWVPEKKYSKHVLNRMPELMSNRIMPRCQIGCQKIWQKERPMADKMSEYTARRMPDIQPTERQIMQERVRVSKFINRM